MKNILEQWCATNNCNLLEIKSIETTSYWNLNEVFKLINKGELILDNLILIDKGVNYEYIRSYKNIGSDWYVKVYDYIEPVLNTGSLNIRYYYIGNLGEFTCVIDSEINVKYPIINV